jgi:Amidase
VVFGPMARDMGSCTQWMRIFLDKSTLDRDRTLIPIPWREKEFRSAKSGALRVGYHMSLDLIPVSVACRRPVEKALEIIRQKDRSIELVPFEIPSSLILKLVQSWLCLSMNDTSFKEIFQHGVNEFLLPQMFFGKLTCCASTLPRDSFIIWRDLLVKNALIHS